jgi:hypothetical protein
MKDSNCRKNNGEQEESPLTATKHEIIRNENGQFSKGSSGNPGGRPKKTLTILLKHKLDENLIAGDVKTTIGEYIVDQAIKLACCGDMQAIKWIFERVDGRPIPMKMELMNKMEPIRILEVGFTKSLEKLADDEVIVIGKDGAERVVNKREFDSEIIIG